jgi:hypothetical protein
MIDLQKEMMEKTEENERTEEMILNFLGKKKEEENRQFQMVR